MFSKKSKSTNELLSLLTVLNVLMLAVGITLLTLHLTGTIAGKTGPPGPPGSGSSAPEMFSIALGANISLDTADVYHTVTQWTDTIDTVLFPCITPKSLFQTLTTGVLNLTAGTFTAGAEGTYQFFYPQNVDTDVGIAYGRLAVNSRRVVTWQSDAALFPVLLQLSVGDIVTYQLITDFAPSFVAPAVEFFTAGVIPSHNLVWRMVKVN